MSETPQTPATPVSTPPAAVAEPNKSDLFTKTEDQRKPHALHREINKQSNRVVYKTKSTPRGEVSAAPVEAAKAPEAPKQAETAKPAEATETAKPSADAAADKPTDTKAEAKETEKEADAPADKEVSARMKKIIESEGKLLKAKQELSKKETEVKTRLDNLSKLEQEFDADPLTTLTKYVKGGEAALTKAIKADPVEFCKRLGVMPNDYLSRFFNPGDKPAATEAAPPPPVKAEVSKEMQEALDEIRKDKAERQKATNKEISDKYMASTASFLTSNRETYPLLHQMYPGELGVTEVAKLQALTFKELLKKYGTEKDIPQSLMLTRQQSADKLEAYLKTLQQKLNVSAPPKVETPADAAASPKSAPLKETATTQKEVAKPRRSQIMKDDRRPYVVKTRA